MDDGDGGMMEHNIHLLIFDNGAKVEIPTEFRIAYVINGDGHFMPAASFRRDQMAGRRGR